MRSSLRFLRALTALPFFLALLSCVAPSSQDSSPRLLPFELVDSGAGDFIYRTIADRRLFRTKKLENGLQVILVSDPDAHDSAAAMQVDVGSGADPIEYQGLAHFLEHMLFLGSAEYPTAGEFSEFTARHGGSDNAFTSPDATVYFFKIKPEALVDGLDRFSGFFIDPLFTKEYVQREINAVDAEYYTRAEHEGLKIFEASKTLMSAGHPMRKLSVGNVQTLLGDQAASEQELLLQHDRLRSAMLEFYEQHYHASNMRLAIVGPQSLDELESVIPLFASIRPSVSNEPEVSSVMPLWEPVDLSEKPPVLLVETRQPINLLAMRFALQDIKKYLPSKSISYVLDVLGHEGKNSLLSTLRKEGLATGISAATGFNYLDSAVLSVDIELTQQGLASVSRVTALFYKTVESIRRELLRDASADALARYEEQKLLAHLDARFYDTPDVVRAALGAVGSPRFYPLPLTFVSPFWFDGFDKDLKLELLSSITPENSRITLASDQLGVAFTNVGALLDRQTQWYPVRFGLLGGGFMPCDHSAGGCDDMDLLADENFGLPRANRYVPEAFTIKNPLILKDAVSWERPKPTLAAINDWGRVWFLQDRVYGKPLADYMFLLRHDGFLSGREVVLQSLYIEWVREYLTEAGYEAHLAGQNYRMSNHSLGLVVKVSGYDDNLQQFLVDVLQAIQVESLGNDVFEQIKSNLLQSFERRRLSDPMARLSIALEEALDPFSRDLAMFQAELDSVSLEDLRAHIAEQKNFVRMDVIAHGNLSDSDVNQLLSLPCLHLDCSRALKYSADDSKLQVLEEMRPATRKVESGMSRVEVPVYHSDHAAWWYFQASGDSLSDQMQTYLLGDLLSQPFYRELRTEQQLGYIVSAGGRIDNDTAGLNLAVQSARFDDKHLNASIEEQVERWLDLIAKGEGVFDTAVIEQHRQALLARLKRPDASLHDRSSALFNSLLRGDTGFSRQLEIVEVLESLEIDRFRSFARELLAEESRRLLVMTANPVQ